MGIMDRLSRLIRANVNDMIDKAEDPEKMLDQILRDMQSNITQARSQVAAMIAQEKELEADLNETQQLANEWGQKAQRAVTAGKDDLAREALRRRRDNEENAKVYAQQYQAQQQMVEKLKAQLRLLESKYQATLSQRDSLIARQRRAKALTQVTASVSTFSPLDPSAELERMERKIRSNEAHAAALTEMTDSSYEAQFRELDYDTDIESQLEALKAGNTSVLESGAPAVQPPALGDGSDDDATEEPEPAAATAPAETKPAAAPASES